MVKLDPNTMPPTVAIILVSWNTRELLRRALQSIREHAAMPVHVVVVDNASGDGSPKMVRAEFPEATLIVNPDNRGFGQANNQGFAASDAPLILLLNSDAELTPGGLPALVDALQRHPEAGAVGARLVFPDGRFQASYASFPSLFTEALQLAGLAPRIWGRQYPSRSEAASRQARAVDWVGGACMLLRRTAIQAVHGFDADFHLYAEETDLCRRIHNHGWSVRYCPIAIAVHHGGQSAALRAPDQPLLLWRSRVLYFSKHRPAWEAAVLERLVRMAHSLRAVVWSLRAGLSPASAAAWRQRADSARRVARELRSA